MRLDISDDSEPFPECWGFTLGDGGRCGPSETCGRIHVGDILIGVNGKPLAESTNDSFADVTGRLKGAPWPRTLRWSTITITPEEAVSTMMQVQSSDGICIEYDPAIHLKDSKKRQLGKSELRGLEPVLLEDADGGNAASVEELLNMGVDPMCRDDEERTSLMKASLNGHHEVVRIVLESFSNFSKKPIPALVNAKDKYGNTALFSTTVRPAPESATERGPSTMKVCICLEI